MQLEVSSGPGLTSNTHTHPVGLLKGTVKQLLSKYRQLGELYCFGKHIQVDGRDTHTQHPNAFRRS